MENGEIKCKKLIGALNDTKGFTMRNLIIESQNNDIHILDGKDILFENIHFKLPHEEEVIINIEGAKSTDILFKQINGIPKNVEYKKLSPIRIKTK